MENRPWSQAESLTAPVWPNGQADTTPRVYPSHFPGQRPASQASITRPSTILYQPNGAKPNLPT